MFLGGNHPFGVNEYIQPSHVILFSFGRTERYHLTLSLGVSLNVFK